MPYCMYLRKSRRDIEAEQHGAGETLSRHKDMLLDLANRRGITVDKIYQEIVSADTIAARPVMQQLLSDIQAGLWDAVLVAEIERLARGDTMDQGQVAQAFKFSSTRIITPARDYDPNNESDEEYFEFGLFMARREYKTTTRRLQAGREASAHEGKYPGAVDPYGYMRYKLKGEKGWSLRIVPEEAEHVRLMYSLFAYGREIEKDGQTVHEPMGAAKVADVLNELGSRTRKGNPWTTSAVRVLIHNPLYCGLVQWYTREKKVQMVDGRRVTTRPFSDRHFLAKGRHEPIVDQALWDAAQAASKNRNKLSVNRSKDTVNPLAGIIKCSECGKAMVRTPMYGHLAGVDYLKCSTPRCPTSSCPLEDVETMILSTLSAWLKEAPLPAAAPVKPDASAETMRLAAEAHLAELEKRRTRLMDLLEQGVYDTTTYIERSSLLAKEITAAKSALESIPVTKRSNREKIADLLPEITHVLQAYPTAVTPAEKNQLLRSVIDHITYHKTHRCFRNENPAAFVSLDIFPKEK